MQRSPLHQAVEEKAAGAVVEAASCSAGQTGLEQQLAGVEAQLAGLQDKQEQQDRRAAKFLLVFTGLRKQRRLERPFHVAQVATEFIHETLGNTVSL